MTAAQGHALEVAAAAAALGIDPRPLIMWRDPAERVLWQRLIERAIAHRGRIDENVGLAIAEQMTGGGEEQASGGTDAV